jgi:hypothetical protein
MAYTKDELDGLARYLIPCLNKVKAKMKSKRPKSYIHGSRVYASYTLAYSNSGVPEDDALNSATLKCSLYCYNISTRDGISLTIFDKKDWHNEWAECTIHERALYDDDEITKILTALIRKASRTRTRMAKYRKSKANDH